MFVNALAVLDRMWMDFAVVLVYLAGITLYGLYVGRNQPATSEGYFLGGRSFGWFTIGASIYATNISAVLFLSTSGLAHSVGVAAINNELIGVAMLGLSAIYFVPLYVRSRLCTMTEFLKRRYGRPAQLVYSGTFLLHGFLSVPVGFYAGGLAVVGLFGFGPQYLPLACLAIGGTLGLYSIVGGLSSIVKTEVVQCMLLIVGGLIVTWSGLHAVGGWTVLRHEFEASHFQLLLPRGTNMPWTALPGIVVASSFFAFCNVGILQRALGARSVRQAQGGLLFSAYLKFLGLPLFAVPGIVAAKLYPTAAGDATYAMMVRDLLPPGVSGLVMAGLLAALMSSAESGIGAISSVAAYDVYPALTRRTNPQTGIRVGRWAAATITLFAILVAPIAGELGPIYLFTLRLAGFLYMPIGVCMIFGRLSRRVNNQGALSTLILGAVIGTSYVLCTSVPGLQARMPLWFQDMHFYEVLPLFFLFCVLVLYLVSWLTPPPPAENLTVLEAAGEPASPGRGPAFFIRSPMFWFSVALVLVAAHYVVF